MVLVHYLVQQAVSTAIVALEHAILLVIMLVNVLGVSVQHPTAPQLLLLLNVHFEIMCRKRKLCCRSSVLYVQCCLLQQALTLTISPDNICNYLCTIELEETAKYPVCLKSIAGPRFIK